jgi:hypothetical protein
MIRADDNPSVPLCPSCAMPMALVQVDPRVAAFAQLCTFRCFGCGERQAVEQPKSPYLQAADDPRPPPIH